MESYTTTITPRLRVARTSLNYDRSVSQIATATEGPSHLPEFSQLVDLSLNEIAPSEASEQPSTSTVPDPYTSTRSENPAAVLRALLSRLPAESKSSPPSQLPSQQYLSERESDYDMDLTEPASAVRSMVQENLKDIFSKARRDPGDTPQKVPTRRDSNSASEENPDSIINMRRNDSRGKRRSTDDEMDNTSVGFSQRPPTRFKHSPQPVTLEFLRERFSDSRFSNGSVGGNEDPLSIHDFSNDVALSQELNSFQTNVPVATSTPQQSLRMSFNSQFQSNLLDQDTEMQHVIDELDSYGESSANRPISPPPTLQKRPTSRLEHLTPFASNSIEDNNKTPSTNRTDFRPLSPAGLRSNNVSSDKRDHNGIFDLDHDQLDDWGQSQISRGSGHSYKSKPESLDEPTPRAGNRGHPSVYHPSTPSGDGPSRLDDVPGESESLHSTTPPNSPPYANIGQSFSPQENPFTVPIVEDHDYDEFENTSKAERKWESPYSARNTSSATRPLTPSSISPPIRKAKAHLRSNSFRSVNESKANNRPPGEHSISAGDYSNLEPSQEEVHRSISPLHSSPSGSGSGLGHTSLQAIDNTYHHNDPSLRHRLRSLSPLPSSPNVNLKYSNMSNASKRLRLDTRSSGWKHAASSREWASSTQDLSVISTSSSQSKQAIRASSSWSSRLAVNEGQNDKTRETNLSSDRTPEMKHGPAPNVSDFEEQRPVTPPSRISSRLSNAPTIPHILVNGQTSPSNPFEEILLSPSTPSRRTPKNIRRGHKSPSPTKGPPDLPTPSSSDESNYSPWDHAVTPESIIDGGSNTSWLPTPRPPGGWLQTPIPPRIPSGPYDQSTPDSEPNTDSDSLAPKTPLRTVNTTSSKTPRPPGAWQTPVLVSKLAYLASSDERDRESIQDLPTPSSSLSKGSFPEPKTPYVPGGWTATSTARKSILKVRFNQGEEASSVDNTLTPHPRNNYTSDKYAAKNMTTEDSSSVSPSSSRTLRHTQPSHIRVLDAYGQEASDDLHTQRSTPNRSALRVVDSMGREVQESDQTGEDEPIDEDPQPSRTELLSRIRRGLDNLAEDIDEIDRENDARFKDEARMEELNVLSIQARKNRERLLAQAANFQPKPDGFRSNAILSSPFESKSRPSNRRRYVVMLLVQILLVLVMYRLSVHRARELFLNSYYDPFNPDLYLYVFKYDTSFQLFNADFSMSSPRFFGEVLLQGGGKAWASCFHLLCDVKSYIWKLWAIESASLHTTTWAPT